jgi:hypothetical protein
VCVCVRACAADFPLYKCQSRAKYASLMHRLIQPQVYDGNIWRGSHLTEGTVGATVMVVHNVMLQLKFGAICPLLFLIG